MHGGRWERGRKEGVHLLLKAQKPSRYHLPRHKEGRSCNSLSPLLFSLLLPLLFLSQYCEAANLCQLSAYDLLQLTLGLQVFVLLAPKQVAGDNGKTCLHTPCTAWQMVLRKGPPYLLPREKECTNTVPGVEAKCLVDSMMG